MKCVDGFFFVQNLLCLPLSVTIDIIFIAIEISLKIIIDF